jgi:hypothetical protein
VEVRELERLVIDEDHEALLGVQKCIETRLGGRYGGHGISFACELRANVRLPRRRD